MKMKKLYLILLAAALLSAPLFYSCSLDNDSNYGYGDGIKAKYVALSTIQVIEGQDYYFLSDDEERIFPVDTTHIHKYDVIDGQRVYVYFDLIDKEATGNDYDARIKAIQDILTKGVIPITEATQDSIGDDRVNFTARWFGGDHLNIAFQVIGSRNHQHMINLVKDENTEDDEYVNLEFRHNAKGDLDNDVLGGIVSFKKPFTDDPTKKGLRIRVNTIYNGEQFYTIDFDSKEIHYKNSMLAGEAMLY